MRKICMLLLTVVLALAMCACERGGKGEDSGKVTEPVKPTSDASKPTAKVVIPTAEATQPAATATPTPTPEPEPVTLEMWCDVTQSDARRYAFDMAAMQMVKNHPEYNFSWEALEHESYLMKLADARNAGKLPDIFLERIGEDLTNSAGKGELFCLDDVYEKYSGSLPRKMCDTVTVDNKLYGIPYTMELFCLYVNTDLLSEAGYDKVPSTYSELITCCDALMEKGITPFAFCGEDTEYVSEFLGSVMEKTCGARVMGPIYSGNSSWVNGEVAGAVNAFRYMMEKGYFGEEYSTASHSTAQDQFLQGKAAFFMDSSRNTEDYSTIGNVKVSEFPVVNGKKSGQGQLIGETRDVFVVSAGSANSEAAAQFAYEFAKLASQYEYLCGSGIPVWKVDYEDPDVDLLTRSAVNLANNVKNIVPFAEEAMGSANAGRFRQECGKVLNEENFDGIAFIRDMSGQDIPEGTVAVFDPLDNSGGGAAYDPNRDLNDLYVLVGDWWSPDVYEPFTQEEIIRAQYLSEMMERHHFTIERRAVCGWGDQLDTYVLSILTNEPLADVMAVDYRFVGDFLYDAEQTLLTDVSKLPEFDFTDSKWNQQIRKCMTVGTAVYGFTTEHEPATGVFWNKNLVEKFLGKSEVDRIYDLQASGTWTWDAFRDFAAACTRDTDADGVVDVYGLAVYQADFFEAAVLSNGHQFVDKDADGRYINKTTSKEIIEDCNWAYSFYEDGLARRPLDDEGYWDYFWKDFSDQKAVMMVVEEYYAGYMQTLGNDGSGQTPFEYGFACFPKGPNATDYMSVTKDIVFVIPNCPKTQVNVNSIAFAFNIYTDVPPELQEDPGAWKLQYETSLDKRAIDETLAMMLYGDISTGNLSMPIPGLWNNNSGGIQMQLLYQLDGKDATPEKRLKAADSQIQACVDSFNEAYLK